MRARKHKIHIGSEESSKEWYKPALKELENIFQRTNQQFDLVKKMAESILLLEKRLDEIFKEICFDLREVANADGIEVFILSGEEFIPMNLSIENGLKDLDFSPGGELADVANLKKGEHLLVQLRKGSAFEWLVFLPIFLQKDLFGIMALAQKSNSSSVILNNKGFLSFIGIVANQLGIMTERYLEKKQLSIQTKLIKLFFNSKLVPSACWEQIVDEIVHFLPDWHPLVVKPVPKVQLLLYNEGDRHLWIAGTQGNEEVGTEVLVDSSICGMLVIDRSSDFVLINPNKHLDKYKGFLLGKKKEIPQSELAVRIALEEEIVGVVNLEHPQANVFKLQHIQTLRAAATFIAPFIEALRSRYARQRTKELEILYTVTRLLGRTASTYQHILGHPLVKSRLTMERLYKGISELPTNIATNIQNRLDEMSRHINQIHESSDRFCNSLPAFMTYGPVDVLSAIKQAIAPSETMKFVQEENIKIDLRTVGEIEKVYASALLQEHFYNLIDNSIYAIRQALLEKKINRGVIDIIVKSISVKDGLGVETGSKLIDVRVEDNGTGAPIDCEKDIGKPRFTTKGGYGSGYGLSAAKEYMQSVGGDLAWKNKPGKGFVVEFNLEVFDPIKHEKKVK